MSDDPKPKRPRGRPEGTTRSELTNRINLLLPDDLFSKVQAHGDTGEERAKWIRELIRKAK